MEEENLFVYGTLRRGADNQFATYLRQSGQLLGQGRVKGRLYAIAEYPGLVLSNNDEEWVQGDVYRLSSPETTYRILDAYEGCGPNDPLPHEFSRAMVSVLLPSGQWLCACTYLYVSGVIGKQQIESGDFLAFLPMQVKGF